MPDRETMIKRLAVVHSLLSFWPIGSPEVKKYLEQERDGLVEALEHQEAQTNLSH
jgi:hypothetical protein